MTTRTLVTLLCVFLVSSGALAQSSGFARIYEKKAAFAEVQQDVTDAIVGGGYVIDYTAKIGDMLARTAKDVGATREVYKNAVALQFCSVKLSREMFEADPATIVLCPYVIAIYERADKPGTTYVSYRRPPAIGNPKTRKAVAAVDKLLQEIIGKALK